MGTAGALGILDTPTETTLVINGDILTRVDFRAMLAFHREHVAELTIAVHQQNFQVPYGIVESDGVYVRGFAEKPVLKYFVNAGMYLLEPSAYGLIPSGEHYDMTDLIQRLLDEGRSVVAFPVHEYWIDIGQPDDYVKAQQDFLDGNTPQ
jgi:NDP-sugar pyrophosphorylase family protein